MALTQLGLVGPARQSKPAVTRPPKSAPPAAAMGKQGGPVSIEASSVSRREPATEVAQPPWLGELHETASLRQALPPAKERKPYQISQVLQLFKDLMGRDLAEVEDLSLPTGFCEPITDMQRRGEFLEYAELLDSAALAAPGSLGRLLAVAAYAVSIYSCVTRPLAPFRSFAGETLEVTSREKGVRAIGEKCGECPGVNAFHCEGRGWVLSADEVNHIQFRGNHAHFRPKGLIRVAFPDGEELSWHPLLTTLKNILLGAPRLTHSGVLHVRSSTSGLAAKLTFAEPLLSLRPTYLVEGRVERAGLPLQPPVRLLGCWNAKSHADAKLEAVSEGQRTLLWAKNPPGAAAATCRFGFSPWAASVCDRPAALLAAAPPSDVRRRGDLRLLEEGRYEESEAERQRILKRLRRARRAVGSRTFVPRWFTLHPEVPVGEGKRLTYKGGYWEARAAVQAGRNRWEGCADLYGEDGNEDAVYAANGQGQ